jgi:hypothetical protein
MRFARVRLALALLALFAWVGYIAYQAVTYGRFPVVSHSQLLVSTLDVIADVTADAKGLPDRKVHIVEVHWPNRQKSLVGQDIEVANLPIADGFRGPGRYILPLIVGGNQGPYLVAGLPRSPGFNREAFFIYPDLPITREQLNTIPKPRDGE